MRKLLFLFLVVCCSFTSSETPIKSDCTCKGKKLYGRVKVVKSDADFVIKETTGNFYNIIVKKKDSPIYLENCGEWYFTDDNFYDFTVQFTDGNLYDFIVKYTSGNFYGIK